MNLGITRKEFLRAAVMGTAGLVTLPVLAAMPASPVEATQAKTIYRIQPLPGKKYNRSFLNFCQRSQFDSAAAAVKRVKDRRHGYLLVAQPV